MRIRSYLIKHTITRTVVMVVCSVLSGLAIYLYCDFLGGSDDSSRTLGIIPSALMVVLVHTWLFKALGDKGTP